MSLGRFYIRQRRWSRGAVLRRSAASAHGNQQQNCLHEQMQPVSYSVGVHTYQQNVFCTETTRLASSGQAVTATITLQLAVKGCRVNRNYRAASSGLFLFPARIITSTCQQAQNIHFPVSEQQAAAQDPCTGSPAGTRHQTNLSLFEQSFSCAPTESLMCAPFIRSRLSTKSSLPSEIKGNPYPQREDSPIVRLLIGRYSKSIAGTA